MGQALTEGQDVRVSWSHPEMYAGVRVRGKVVAVMSRPLLAAFFKCSESGMPDADHYAVVECEHPHGGKPGMMGLALRDGQWRLAGDCDPDGPRFTLEAES